MVAKAPDPRGARAYVRAMAGARVEAILIMPAETSDTPAPALWEDTITKGGYCLVPARERDVVAACRS